MLKGDRQTDGHTERGNLYRYRDGTDILDENLYMQCVQKQLHGDSCQDDTNESHSRIRCTCSPCSSSRVQSVLLLSFILNLFLISVISVIFLTDRPLHGEYLNNSSRRILGDTVCMPCGYLERFIPWEKWKYIHMHVLKDDVGDVCCFHRSNYLQILIKLLNFAQRRQTVGDRPCHSIVSSHFNISGIRSDHNTNVILALADGGINYGQNAQNGLEIHNGIVRMVKKDFYQIHLQITVRFDHRESPKDFHLYIVRLGAQGTNSTISQRHLTSGIISGEGIGYQTVYIFELVFFQEGDRIAIIVDNRSLVYRSFECNFVGLIGS